MVGLPKGVFLIKYKIIEFEGFKNLMDFGGFVILGISGEPIVRLRSEGKTEIKLNKEKRYSLYSGRRKKIRFIT